MPDQSTLKKFLARRHPEYHSKLPHWLFCEATYEGGRDWFKGNIHRYVKEGDDEHKKRLDRAYRFNHTREAVDLIGKYIFKSPIARNMKDVPAQVQSFWAKATLSGLSIEQFMRLVSTASSVYGRIWIFVDSTKSGDVVSIADEKAAGARTYAYIVPPQDVLDVGFADDGDPSWILVRERVRDDKDPIFSSGAVTERYRLWDPNGWVLFRLVQRKHGSTSTISIDDLASTPQALMDRSVQVVIDDAGPNPLGRLPCFPHDHVIGDHRYSAPSLIGDIAYLDKAIANYLSNLDAIIQDQTFSQLAMPAQNILPGDDKYEQIRDMGTKRIFLYDGDGGAMPTYISPDVKQADLLVTVVNKIINEVYHTIGMGGERTKQDNAVGIDNSSGVAKAYDFERLNSLLVTKSQSLENAEYEMIGLVKAWSGDDAAIDRSEGAPVLVKYADTFDVRSLFDEFTVAEKLMLMAAPDTVRQQQMTQVVDKLFPALPKDLKAAMLADIKNNWPPEPPPETVTTTASDGTASAKATSGGPTPASKNPSTKSRQGQVTSQTK